jgi:hypothetical protein
MTARIELAAYDTAHNFPGGAKALAERIGIRPSTLYSKVDPAVDTHHLALTEALAMMIATGDFRVLHALADACGFVAIPKSGDGGDAGLFDLVCSISESSGFVASEIRSAFSDNNLSDGERRKIIRRVADAVESLQALARFISPEKGG